MSLTTLLIWVIVAAIIWYILRTVFHAGIILLVVLILLSVVGGYSFDTLLDKTTDGAKKVACPADAASKLQKSKQRALVLRRQIANTPDPDDKQPLQIRLGAVQADIKRFEACL